MTDTIYYTFININGADIFVGQLSISNTVNNHIITFKYSDEWLNSPLAFPLGNDLPLTNETFISHDLFSYFNYTLYTALNDFSNNMLFVYLLRHHLLTKEENIPAKYLYDALQEGSWSFGSIYLYRKLKLINDYTRMGALRFKLSKDGEFISVLDKNLILTENNIDEMSNIINRIINKRENKKDLEIVRASMFGLKGRFPKFNVFDKNGNLCIAKIYDKECKFLRANYKYETFAIDLSRKCNNKPVDYRVVEQNGKTYLLIKRYDRDGENRLPTCSLKSLLQPFVPNDFKKISDCIKFICKNSKKNLELYYQRYLFRIAISDYSEYTVNAEFVYDGHSGFNLSPDLDLSVAPQNTKNFGITKLQFKRRAKRILKEALDNSIYFNVSKPHAKKMLKNIAIKLKNWKFEAKSYGFSDEEINKMLIFENILKLC